MRMSEHIEHKEEKSSTEQTMKIITALGYPIGIIALVLALTEKKDKFVKYHSLQAIFFWISFFVCLIGLKIIKLIFSIIPLGWIISWIISAIIFLLVLGTFILSIYYAVCVSRGEIFRIPVVTTIMERFVGTYS